MNYSALIQNRKSARGFSDEFVKDAQYAEIKRYYENNCKKLCDKIKTDLVIVDYAAKRNLEGAAGYDNNLIGAPAYMVLLTEDKEGAIANASYMMEDLVLKLLDMGLGSCFITFADGQRIKDAMELATDQDHNYDDLQVAAVIAFGNELKMAKRMRFNLITMAKIGNKEKRHYFDPKKKIEDMVYLNTWGNTDGVDETIGFYDSILWEALYAATQSPSYLNRQPYAFVLKDHEVALVSIPDEFTDPVSEQQGLGIVMLHFAAVASEVSGAPVAWKADTDATGMELPEGYKVVAKCVL